MLSWKESLTTHHKRAATLVKIVGYLFLHFVESLTVTVLRILSKTSIRELFENLDVIMFLRSQSLLIILTDFELCFVIIVKFCSYSITIVSCCFLSFRRNQRFNIESFIHSGVSDRLPDGALEAAAHQQRSTLFHFFSEQSIYPDLEVFQCTWCSRRFRC